MILARYLASLSFTFGYENPKPFINKPRSTRFSFQMHPTIATYIPKAMV
jgi:hypothetical protein